jgi:hypothetical protein
MGIEEQKEEREVLGSIFPDEITGITLRGRPMAALSWRFSLDISDTAYRIAIALDVTSHDDEPIEQPTIYLNVSYPETYPDVAPNLDISAAPNASPHPLINISEDKGRLLDSLTATIDESLGMAMVFTLVSTLKESAETLIAERQRQAQNVKDIEAAKAEEEENRKFHGTAVTRESFLKWRAKFREEMEERERREKEEKEAEEKKKRGRLEEKKLTGKQLWEGGMAGKVDEDDEGVQGEDVDGIASAAEKLNVDG